MKLHSSMLGMFFVYTLAIGMPIFKKKKVSAEKIGIYLVDRDAKKSKISERPAEFIGTILRTFC